MIWFVIKVVLCIFVFVWLRGTLPRLRYDQFMHLGWKVLIPINLIWILAVTSIHVLRDRGWSSWEATLVPLAIVLIIVVVPVLMALEGAAARRAADRIAEDEAAAQQPPTFPIPPLDLVVPNPPKRLATTSAGAPNALRTKDESDD
jgi:NADH-quinone oxidoreductase subunit H